MTTILETRLAMSARSIAKSIILTLAIKKIIPHAWANRLLGGLRHD